MTLNFFIKWTEGHHGDRKRSSDHVEFRHKFILSTQFSVTQELKKEWYVGRDLDCNVSKYSFILLF